MMKKDYMTPEMEEIKVELEGALMELSTPDGEYSSEDIDDI